MKIRSNFQVIFLLALDFFSVLLLAVVVKHELDSKLIMKIEKDIK